MLQQLHFCYGILNGGVRVRFLGQNCGKAESLARVPVLGLHCSQNLDAEDGTERTPMVGAYNIFSKSTVNSNL